MPSSVKENGTSVTESKALFRDQFRILVLIS